MRLDKYLKVSRLIVRRTVAKKACESDKVEVNGVFAKPATNVEVGDIIKISLGKNPLTVKVLELREHVGKDEATELYEIQN